MGRRFDCGEEEEWEEEEVVEEVAPLKPPSSQKEEVRIRALQPVDRWAACCPGAPLALRMAAAEEGAELQLHNRKRRAGGQSTTTTMIRHQSHASDPQ